MAKPGEKFYLDARGIKAAGIVTENGFTVFSGSEVRNREAAYTAKTILDRRHEFDLWLFNMGLTEIIGEKDYTKAIDSVVAICNLLLQKLTVPAVAARKEHLIEFVKAEYWVNRTIDKLECVRIQVRDLLKYLDRGPVLNLVIGFEDTLIEKQGGHIPVTPDFRNYKQKVLDYLIEHSDSPVLEKIKTLQPITVEEVKELELFLVNGTAESLITAELSNWNGKAIKIPRTEVSSCERDDIKGVGVYFLICQEDDGTDSVYIGEAENVLDRLTQHLRDYQFGKKPFS